jgi:hypothetical protein
MEGEVRGGLKTATTCLLKFSGVFSGFTKSKLV